MNADNGTKVKIKKLQPTEMLLRKTLSILAPYSFVLGVEPPRKEANEIIQQAIALKENWLVQDNVLPLDVIYLCINRKEIEETLKKAQQVNTFLRQVFKKTEQYSQNWTCNAKESNYALRLQPIRRLKVNGYAIEIYEADNSALQIM